MHYYLVDDCVEVREVQTPNNGRDPFPILLRRQRLPKSFRELADLNDNSSYTWKDLRIGTVINVLGRKFLIRDCDQYTRDYYYQNLGLSDRDMKPLPFNVDESYRALLEQELAPYNGFGSIEDSMGSCKYLVLKPPKKDFIKMLENEHKILRFVARMESKHKEDRDRRFVVSYRLADDMITIYEPPQRNAGIIGGKFLERTRVLKPGSSLSDPTGPKYYEVQDFHIGSVLKINGREFILLDADEYVFNYMESHEAHFPLSQHGAVLARMKKLVGGKGSDGSGSGSVTLRKEIENKIKEKDGEGAGKLDRKVVVATVKQFLKDQVSDHEIITLTRRYEDKNRKVDYLKFMGSLM
ncbi:EF-hand domain-containing protein 1 [Quaeritorhiza haematococci]|nr:EF-hand domain-containing protein 1 [Quaeritorhiza haematococci]